MCFLDITQTAVHGDLFHPICYVPFVGQYGVRLRVDSSPIDEVTAGFGVVSTDHATGLGPRGETISRG